MADRCGTGLQAQSIVLSKQRFPTAFGAQRWLRDHGYRIALDEKTNTWRARQKDPSQFRYFVTKSFAPGISATLGCPTAMKRAAEHPMRHHYYENPMTDGAKLAVAMAAGAVAAVVGGGIAFAMTKPPAAGSSAPNTIQQGGIYTLNLITQPTVTDPNTIAAGISSAGWTPGSQVTFLKQQPVPGTGGFANLWVVQATWTGPNTPAPNLPAPVGPNALLVNISGPGLPAGGISA